MHAAKARIPTAISAPGAVVRQAVDFGDASGYGKIAGEYLSLAAGTDIAPLLKGLEGDLCQSPHWGYLIEGEVTVTYDNGQQEPIVAGDLFYWPPGHTVKVDKDAEIIVFSPQAEHRPVLEHLGRQMQG
ncbi:MAG TPA: cupin domain-containing protein [Vicinamibacterales bacterium]|nr:cupin domain-containing protein [Vicinamibacterales bacterium]